MMRHLDRLWVHLKNLMTLQHAHFVFCLCKTKVGRQHFPKVGKKISADKIVMTILGNSPLGGVKRILQFYNFYADYMEVFSGSEAKTISIKPN